MLRWPALGLLLTSAATAQLPYRSIDGSGNNIWNPTCGKANTPLVRFTMGGLPALAWEHDAPAPAKRRPEEKT